MLGSREVLFLVPFWKKTEAQSLKNLWDAESWHLNPG